MSSYTGKRKRFNKGNIWEAVKMKFAGKGPFKSSKKFKSGYNRTGGFYGRYAGRNAELKFFDTTLTGTLDSTGELLPGGGTTTGLNLIPQGITESTRIGRKCVIKKISIQGYLYTSTADGSDTFRIHLVLDKQANGAYPAYSDIVTASALTGFNNLSNSQRFKILKTWKGPINTTGVTTNFDANTRFYPAVYKKIKYNKKCNIPLEFSSTTGAITELKSNNLIFIAQSVLDDKTNFVLNTRLRFSDGS